MKFSIKRSARRMHWILGIFVLALFVTGVGYASYVGPEFMPLGTEQAGIELLEAQQFTLKDSSEEQDKRSAGNTSYEHDDRSTERSCGELKLLKDGRFAFFLNNAGPGSKGYFKIRVYCKGNQKVYVGKKLSIVWASGSYGKQVMRQIANDYLSFEVVNASEGILPKRCSELIIKVAVSPDMPRGRNYYGRNYSMEGMDLNCQALLTFSQVKGK